MVRLEVVFNDGSIGTFTSSSGAVETVVEIGTHVFPAEGWTDITSFIWDVTSDMAIDNLVIEARPNGP